MKIAVFDSGVGGLNILHGLQMVMPKADYIYYADLKNVPYGNKTPEEIRFLMHSALEMFLECKADLIVLACNTATSVAVAELRLSHPHIPIVGMEPAVKPAVKSLSPESRVLVTATDLTLRLEKLERLIRGLHAESRIDFLSLQALVEFAEAGQFEGGKVDKYLKERLLQFNFEQVQAVVLGCTHFMYFYPTINQILPNHVKIIDGNDGTIRRVQALVSEINGLNDGSGKTTFVVTGNSPTPDELTHFHACMTRTRLVYELKAQKG